jgi:hypothetical protein
MLMKRILISLILSMAAFAQTDRGTITGLVTDPAGAVVANAQLELRGTETGTTYPAATSATGNYTFSQLPVGPYELTLSVPGFKRFVRQNLRVQGAQTIGVDIQLEVGAATESVTVSAEVSLLRTESSDISTNVDSSRMTSLPILPIGNGFSSSHGVRNPMAVANLAPGTYFDPNLNIKVNGAPSNTQSVKVDGQDASNGVVTFSAAQTQPSVEALQELSIQSSNFSAEFGQAGAGVFNYTSKSGTNRFSGSLYDYFAHEKLNASQAYSHARPQLRRNNFGGTIGGPIIIPKFYNGKERSFFFFNYEAFKETGFIANLTPTVPTDAYRAGDFRQALGRGVIQGSPADSTGLVAQDGMIFDPLTERLDALGRRVRTPFPNNTIPQSRFDPAAVKVLALVPRATLAGLVNNYSSPFPTSRYTSIPAVKIDHSFSTASKIAGYYSRTATSVQYCTPLCGSDGLPDPITATRGTFIESNTVRLNYDHTLTPTLLFHAGAGVLRNDFKDTAPTTDFDLLQRLGIKGAGITGAQGGRFPIIVGSAVAGSTALTGPNSSGGMNSLGPSAGQVRAIETKPTFNMSLNWVKGNHSYKFGAEARLEGFVDFTYTTTNGRYDFNPQQTGNPYFSDANVAINGGSLGFSMASFLLGRVNQVQVSPLTAFRGGRRYGAVFAQDTWKVNRKLTFDYGLRWDHSTYSREQYGRQPVFSATVNNSTAGGRPGGAIFEGNGPGRCNCNFASNYPFAFGPRLGVAYQIDSKTVFRGGFGVTYSASTSGRIAGAPGANQTVDAPGQGDPAMILGDGITNQGTPLNLVWPDTRANLFPLAGTVATPAGFNAFDQNRGRPARQIQWSFGLQRELIRSLVVEAAYVGNRGAWWATPNLTNYNVVSPQRLASFGLDILNAADRTILGSQIQQAGAGRFRNQLPYAGFPGSASVLQSLRPFPQFGDLTGAGPLGRTWYDSLQLKATKRLSRGLDVSYNFTWSKELQLSADTDGGGGTINDILNRNTNKQFSSFSRPIWSVLALNYETQKIGSNRLINHVIAGWTAGGVFQYGSGLPILIPATGVATSNLQASLGRPTRAQRVPGVPLFLQDLNCHCFDPAQTVVLNRAAWTDPTPGTFTPSAMYYNDYRFQRRPRETFSLGRSFQLRERMRFWIRAELTNVFNRVQVPNPVVTGYTTNPSTAVSRYGGGTVNAAGFGVISTQPNNGVIGERSGLLVARITF